MLKSECLSLNHLMETLEEVNDGKMALLDGDPRDNVYQMMVVHVPCRLLAHGMGHVAAWNIGFMGETHIYNPCCDAFVGRRLLILLG